jgi:NADPH:quinone reductase-like Zn-dependent oxidoreductase
MKALVFTGIKEALNYSEFPDPTEKEGFGIVEIHSAALNRRDFWITLGMYPGIVFPTVLGSCGAGIYNGREVLINPNINWGEKETHPNKDYIILGLEEPGTFAEKVSVRTSHIFDKPAHLTMDQAAALPLAGLTAYRALFTRAKLRAGEKVLINGVGGGVALFAMQFAIAAGAKVYVTSSSETKIEQAIAMGAIAGGNYTEEQWNKTFKKEHGGFDVIIDSAGGPGFKNMIHLANPGARIALYGGTRGNWEKINPAHVFFKQLTILGSTMGSDADFEKMLALVAEKKIVPIVDQVFNLKDGNEAFALMKTSPQFGKYVLKVK